MKAILFSILAVSFTASALACPGGNIKTLKVGERVLGTINMSTNTLDTVDSQAYAVRITTAANANDVTGDALICTDGVKNCSETSQTLLEDIRGNALPRLTSRPNSEVRVVYGLFDTGREHMFKVSNFRVTRSMGGCGQEIQPIPSIR